jgi:hypothetical protein
LAALVSITLLFWSPACLAGTIVGYPGQDAADSPRRPPSFDTCNRSIVRTGGEERQLGNTPTASAASRRGTSAEILFRHSRLRAPATVWQGKDAPHRSDYHDKEQMPVSA